MNAQTTENKTLDWQDGAAIYRKYNFQWHQPLDLYVLRTWGQINSSRVDVIAMGHKHHSCYHDKGTLVNLHYVRGVYASTCFHTLTGMTNLIATLGKLIQTISMPVYTSWIAILYIVMLNKFCLSPESWVKMQHNWTYLNCSLLLRGYHIFLFHNYTFWKCSTTGCFLRSIAADTTCHFRIK